MIYTIHYNHTRPYKVNVTGLTVSVFKQNKVSDDYGDKPIFVTKAKKIFIGKSSKNESDTYGKAYDGNTILLQLSKNKYMYIGKHIYKFITDSEIIKFISPIGNNDVPYPYAVDDNNNHYLLLERIKIKIPETYQNCYHYYYKARLITHDIAFKTQPIFYSGIVRYTVNNEDYTLIYEPNARQKYNYLKKHLGKLIYITYDDGRIVKVTPKLFESIMTDFNKNLQASVIDILVP